MSTPNPLVLLITLDQHLASTTTSALQHEGYSVLVRSTAAQALTSSLGNDSFHAVIFDTDHQPATDQHILKALYTHVGPARLWLLVPLGLSSWRTSAERLGIKHLISKPLQKHDLERIVDTLQAGLQPHAEISVDSFHHPEPPPYYLEDLNDGRYFLAACPAMKSIYETVRRLAAVDVPVLILGESGVGKDIVATLLHKHSQRSNQNYTSMNCAALPPDLLESELFGYEAGAFTGAIKAKPGKFEIANHGTLLLDEIGEMTAPMQAKLLHVLQNGQFSRLGGRAPTQVDVRVLAATNVNIESALAQNTFREDLYYRISAFTIVVPPLRDRREEIPYLVDHLLRSHAARFREEPVYIPQSVITLMQEYHWPGNLRELSNYVVRIQVLKNVDAVVADLTGRVRNIQPPQNSCPEQFTDETHCVENMRSIIRNFKDKTESRLIQEALDASGWNRRAAAAELSISYRALLYKIQQYNLQQSPQLIRMRRVLSH